MFDLKVIKVFKDTNTLEDVYVIAIKLSNTRYYNLTVTKTEFDNIYNRLKTIYENGLS